MLAQVGNKTLRRPRLTHITPVAFVLMTVATLASTLSQAGAIKGDSGWSDHGREYGFCLPEIMPDSPEGCFFFDREKLEWYQTGRREALSIWRIWKEPSSTAFAKPLLPIYPLQDREKEREGVKLNARIMATDDVVEIWRLKGNKPPDEMGSEWLIIFDYSPDGEWLAAGAVRVAFSSSVNDLHVVVRPVKHWLALAYLRSGLEKLGMGRFRDGLGALSVAGRFMNEIAKGDVGSQGKTFRKPRARFFDEELRIEEPWIEKMGKLGWSRDGKEFCACDAWENEREGKRGACRYFDVKKGTWRRVVAGKVHFICEMEEEEDDGENARAKARAKGTQPQPPPFYTFWADWGRRGDEIQIVVYRVELKTGRLAAIMKKSLPLLQPDDVMESFTAPSFHAIALPSPRGSRIAYGFARREADHRRLTYYIQVEKVQELEARAESDLATYKKSPRKIIEKIPTLLK